MFIALEAAVVALATAAAIFAATISATVGRGIGVFQVGVVSYWRFRFLLG